MAKKPMMKEVNKKPEMGKMPNKVEIAMMKKNMPRKGGK